MDDPYEGRTADLGNQGKYVMVSCWTSRPDEDLLTWSLYTDSLRGVRLKFPVSPFHKAFRIDPSELQISVIGDAPFQSYVPAMDIWNERYQVPGIDFSTGPVQIQYTDDPQLLVPKVLDNGDGTGIILSRLGRYKKRIWKSQSEWRYTFPIFPMTREIIRLLNAPKGLSKFGSLMLEAMSREQGPGIEHLDIPISEKSLEALEITIGPRCDESDRIIIETLVARFTPSARVVDSSLEGDIV
jgi:hypothetical protein